MRSRQMKSETSTRACVWEATRRESLRDGAKWNKRAEGRGIGTQSDFWRGRKRGMCITEDRLCRIGCEAPVEANRKQADART